ncbi:LuxR C-terminal-related transcriptional regulator [Serratia sp. D1N4]
MIKKKIIIQCPCHYTRLGIEGMLRNTQLSEKCDVIDSVSELKQCEKYLREFPVVDIMLLTLSSMVEDPATALHLLGESLPLVKPNTRIVLIADMLTVEVMARYLCGINNVLVVLDKSKSLEIFEDQLLSAFHPLTELYRLGQIAAPSLSLREMTVLRRLLEGQKGVDIANDLLLSNKTVSHYKRSALIKLGIRSLQPLMVNNYRKEIVSKSQFTWLPGTAHNVQTPP